MAGEVPAADAAAPAPDAAAPAPDAQPPPGLGEGSGLAKDTANEMLQKLAAKSAEMGLTTSAPAATEATSMASPAVVLPPGLAGGAPVVIAPTVPGITMPVPKPKILILCDENLLFAAGMQEAYPDFEFTAATILGKPDLERLNFDPNPHSLKGRVRHLTDPTKLQRRFGGGEFDALMLFLPGLACMVPPELGTADRPLFAFRIHWFFFHVVRHAKVLLKGDATKLHLVWPDESGLMTSPCGAAGIEIPQLASFCGCKPLPQEFDIEKLEADAFWPFLFGAVPSEPPEWLSGTTIQSFSYDKTSIPVPLSVALMLHPDVSYACIKDPNSELSNPPGPNAPLRSQLQHEAAARKSRLREIYGHKESPDDVVGAFGLIPEPGDEDSLLSLPMEVFMLSLDDVPHLCNIMKYQVTADQSPQTVPTLEILDPRLPSRIVRPPPKVPVPPLAAAVAAAAKKAAAVEEWGGMKFFCPLTAICTMTVDKMRMHLNGELYKRLASNTPGWEESPDKKRLMDELEKSEAEERNKRSRR